MGTISGVQVMTFRAGLPLLRNQEEPGVYRRVQGRTTGVHAPAAVVLGGGPQKSKHLHAPSKGTQPLTLLTFSCNVIGNHCTKTSSNYQYLLYIMGWSLYL